MSKNKKKKKGGYKPPATTPQDVIDEITKLASEISAIDEAGQLWGQLHKLFLKSPVEPDVAAKIIMHKDVEELKHVVDQLQHGEKATVESEHSEHLPNFPCVVMGSFNRIKGCFFASG